MGSHHLRKLAACEGVRVRAVDPPKGLKGPVGRPDFAVIAVPTSAHLEVALPLLEAGVPCLVEKPLASSIEDAGRLAAFPHCLPGHVERFNPVFHALGGARPRFMQAERMAPPSGRSGDVDVVHDLMIHDLDLAIWLLGEEPSELRAVGLGLPGAQGGEGVDIASVRLETPSGRVANITASRISQRRSCTARLFTSHDYYSLDLRRLQAERVRWAAGELEAQPVPLPPGDGLDGELAALLSHVRGEQPYPVPVHDGLRALEAATRVSRAIARQRSTASLSG